MSKVWHPGGMHDWSSTPKPWQRVASTLSQAVSASLTAALGCAARRFFLAGGAPFIILSACVTHFAVLYLVSINILRIITRDEYQQIRQTITPNFTQSFRYRLA
jgi:hypothetical protein